jgi:aerobic carbon-monoxide dehydrogenase medium subunit
MLLPKFRYLRPETLEEASSMLSRFNGEARLIAGGTDLMVRMKQKAARPAYLIDISNLPGLDAIECDKEDALKIGALCTHSDIESSSLIRGKCNILAQACRSIGSVQIRNLGTIGGNLCNASPSADSAPALLALDAKVKIFGFSGGNTVELAKFFRGPGESILKPGEILTGIDVPAMSPNYYGVYLKLSPRRAMDLAVVGVAIVMCLSGDGSICTDIRIALGAVAPVPMRTVKAEAILRGQKLDEALIDEAAAVAAEETRPITDLRGSLEYRKEMVKVLTRRGICQAIERTDNIL